MQQNLEIRHPPGLRPNLMYDTIPTFKRLIHLLRAYFINSKKLHYISTYSTDLLFNIISVQPDRIHLSYPKIQVPRTVMLPLPHLAF